MADENIPAETEARLAQSAGRLEDSVELQAESADRRTQLAADRTVLAAERTYAAWVRTGLAALASGVGARALLDRLLADWLILATGSILILFSSFCFAAAVWRQAGQITPHPDTKRIPRWLLIAVNGFLMIVSFAALAGLWLS